MVFSSFQRGAIIASLGLALAACGGGAEGEGATAAGPEPEVIDERQANFKAIGDSFKAIREQLETENPDMAIITSAATDLSTAAGKIEGHFPEGTSVENGYDTEALATIWQKPEEFAAAQQMLIDASAEMVTIAEGGDAAAIGAQVGAVGKSCKNCHDQFRVDDD